MIDVDFATLIERVRHGDADAAALLVHQYEGAVRVAIRTRLTDPRLRREFDSMDVCQSVLFSFFIRMALGQFDLHDPAQLVALLVKMAHNKVAMRARASRRECRDLNRTCPISEADAVVDSHAATFEPLRQLVGRETLDRIRRLMPEEIRQMAEMRAQSMSWGEISAALGGTAQGRRKQYERALAKIETQLGSDQIC